MGPDTVQRATDRILSLATLLASALLAWIAFAPGLFSPDSLDQLHQAVAWSFDDWHPPFPAVIAGLLLQLGLPIAALVLLQAAAWAIACGLVIDAGSFRKTPSANSLAVLRPGRAASFAFCTLLAAWSLLPPWPFYAVTFWKDCWTAIGILVLVAGLLRASTRPACTRPAGIGGADIALPRSPLPAQALMIAGAVLASLARHNAAVLLPLAGLGVVLAGSVSRRAAADSAATEASPNAFRIGARVAGGFLLPFLLVSAITQVLAFAVPIAPRPIGVVIMAHELAIAVQSDPDLATQFPYTATAIAPRYAVTTERGDLAALVKRTWWLGPDVGRTLEASRVRGEYADLVVTHPLLVAELKGRSWLNLWCATGSTFWHQVLVEPNDLGLEWAEATRPLRDAWLGLSRHLHAVVFTRVVLAGHLPWLVLGLLLASFSLAEFARRRDAVSALRLLATATPLVYALSFLAAYAVADYRYLYPATITVQALFLAFARAFTRTFTRSGGTPGAV